jgi:Ca2+-transporting ATPase
VHQESQNLKQSYQGLSSLEANLRLKEFGKNQMWSSDVASKFEYLLKFFKDPMGLMMLALSLIYFLLGEKKDALLMLLAFIPVTTVDVYLSIRADKALSILRSTFRPRAKVFRDGVLKDIPITQIVPGDLLVLEEGQTLPADGLLRSSAGLSFNESALTGESLPVDKNENDPVYAGTTVLMGRGTVEVTHTGKKTKFGKIVELLEISEQGKSPLQKKVAHLVAKMAKISAILVACLFVLQIIRGNSILKSVLVALTFGIASVPEEFPLVFTLYLSLGAWRLAKAGVLVKSLPSVETLGSVNVICTDKTGTLTEGKFQLNDIISFSTLSQEDMSKFALLACEPIVLDSMEHAIKEKVLPGLDVSGWQLIFDYPFEKEGKHMSHGWTHPDGESLMAMKGAVEGVLEHCSDSPEKKEMIRKKVDELSSLGFRLLGLAGKKAPLSGDRVRDEEGLSFFAILCFSDPIRESAKSAIEICQAEGIQVKMITGDHPFTAHAIADQLGLEHSHDALYTGSDLKQMPSSARIDAFTRGAIFSRVTPEQKYELVETLKNHHLIVAMTGDGINDAPALKLADIGISMGDNATDAARATAKMVLIKSDFNGIVQAIREGRRIFSNLRKSFSYLISFHVPVIFLSLIPPLFEMGEILLPIHIILLELIVHPVSAFAFENIKSHHLKSNQGLISRDSVFASLLAGVLLSICSLCLYAFMDSTSLAHKRTLALTTVLFGNVGFILLETFPHFTKRLCWILFILTGFTMALFTLLPLSTVFHLTPMSGPSGLICLILGLFSSLPSWFYRRIYRD